jgi:hypothetical protein
VTPSGGASAVPAGGGSSPAHSGGADISLPALRPAREVLAATGAGAGGRPPPLLAPRSAKPGPTLNLGMRHSLGREPRWNAGRRARPAGREPHRRMRRLEIRAFRRSASFVFSSWLVFLAWRIGCKRKQKAGATPAFSSRGPRSPLLRTLCHGSGAKTRREIAVACSASPTQWGRMQ